MSSNAFADTIELQLKPSMRALQILFLLHLAPVALLPFAMQPGPPMALLVGAFGVSWMWLRRHPAFGFGPRALARLVWPTQGPWLLEDASGRRTRAELQGSSYVQPRLVVLNFRLESGTRRTRVLLGDEADAELLRRLRARLRGG